MNNIKINLKSSAGFSWFTNKNIFVKGYGFDKNNRFLKELEFTELFLDVKNETEIIEIIRELNGIFSIVIKTERELFAAVDSTRTFPLFYSLKNNELYLSDDSYSIINGKEYQLDETSKAEFLYTGYVTGDNTLIKNLNQIKAGNVLSFKKELKQIEYHNFKIQEKGVKFNRDSSSLFKVIEDSIKRLIESVEGKTIVIPLSGGYDSRVIATMLRKLNYSNVVCFSYGNINSIDAKISKEVANRLNYKWIFVDYEKLDFSGEYLNSKEFIDYYKYAFNHVSVFLLQDYFAVKYIKENGLVPSNSVIVPGHSGDFLVGNHLYPFDKNKMSKEKIKRQILKRHFVLKGYFKNKNIENKLLNSFSENYLSYSEIDNFNLKERQSKFIVNANKVYEFFGYEHRVPLWDIKLIDYFKELNFNQKLNSKLYFETIIQTIFIPSDVYIIPPDKNKSRLVRNLKEYLPLFLTSIIRSYLHKNKPLNTNIGYFKILKPMVKEYNINSYIINGILSQWLIYKISSKN